MTALFVALNEHTWVNVNDIQSVTQSWVDENACDVKLRGHSVQYVVKCSARDFLNRIESVRT